MTLQFDSGAYGNAFQQGQANQQADRDRLFQLLQSIGPAIGQIGQGYQQRKDENTTLDQLLNPSGMNSRNAIAQPVSPPSRLESLYQPAEGPGLPVEAPQQPGMAGPQLPMEGPRPTNFVEGYQNFIKGQQPIASAGQADYTSNMPSQPSPFGQYGGMTVGQLKRIPEPIQKSMFAQQEPVYSLEGGKLNLAGNVPTGSKVLQPQPSSFPVMNVDPTKGTMTNLGEVPRGAHVVTTPQPSGGPGSKELDTRFTKLGEALDPSKQRQGSFGVSKQVFDRAERLESLASALPDGNLDRRQIEELAIGLNSMLSGANTGAQEQVKALVPQSIWGNTQKLTEFLTNNPTGTQQQAFVQRMLGSIAREKQTAETQMNRTRFSRISSYADLEKKDQQRFNEILNSYGVDPEEYKAWKKGGFKPISAVTQPGDNSSKPKTVIQNGHTYTLNEQTGQYE